MSNDPWNLDPEIKPSNQANPWDADAVAPWDADPAEPTSKTSDALPDDPGFWGGFGNSFRRGFNKVSLARAGNKLQDLANYRDRLMNGGPVEVEASDIGQAFQVSVDTKSKSQSPMLTEMDAWARSPEARDIELRRVQSEIEAAQADAMVQAQDIRNSPPSPYFQELQARLKNAQGIGGWEGSLEAAKSYFSTPGTFEFLGESAWPTVAPAAAGIATTVITKNPYAGVAAASALTAADSYQTTLFDQIAERANNAGVDLEKNPERISDFIVTPEEMEVMRAAAGRRATVEGAMAGVSQAFGAWKAIRGVWQPVTQTGLEVATEALGQKAQYGEIKDPTALVGAGIAGGILEGGTHLIGQAISPGGASSSPAQTANAQGQQAAANQPTNVAPGPDGDPVVGVAGEVIPDAPPAATAEPNPANQAAATQQPAAPAPALVRPADIAPDRWAQMSPSDQASAIDGRRDLPPLPNQPVSNQNPETRIEATIALEGTPEYEAAMAREKARAEAEAARQPAQVIEPPKPVQKPQRQRLSAQYEERLAGRIERIGKAATEEEIFDILNEEYADKGGNAISSNEATDAAKSAIDAIKARQAEAAPAADAKQDEKIEPVASQTAEWDADPQIDDDDARQASNWAGPAGNASEDTQAQEPAPAKKPDLDKPLPESDLEKFYRDKAKEHRANAEKAKADGDPYVDQVGMTASEWELKQAKEMDDRAEGVRAGDNAKAVRDSEAANAGETNEDYRGVHKAPGADSGNGSLDAMDRTYPNDIYGPNGARYYGSGEKLDAKAHSVILRTRGKPDAKVKIYRAVPKGKGGKINPGDWVTTVREYAVDHGQRFDGGADILVAEVRAGDLYTEGNSIFEYGWSPSENAQAGEAKPGAKPQAAKQNVEIPANPTSDWVRSKVEAGTDIYADGRKVTRVDAKGKIYVDDGKGGERLGAMSANGVNSFSTEPGQTANSPGGKMDAARKNSPEVGAKILEHLKNAGTTRDLLNAIVQAGGKRAELARLLLTIGDAAGLAAKVTTGFGGKSLGYYDAANLRDNVVIDTNRKGVAETIEYTALEEVIHALTTRKMLEQVGGARDKLPSSIFYRPTLFDGATSALEKLIKNFEKTGKIDWSIVDPKIGNQLRSDAISSLALAYVYFKRDVDARLGSAEASNTSERLSKYRAADFGEFVAGVLLDPEVQSVLNGIDNPFKTSKTGFFRYVIDLISRMFGMAARSNSLYSAAVNAAVDLASQDRLTNANDSGWSNDPLSNRNAGAEKVEGGARVGGGKLSTSPKARKVLGQLKQDTAPNHSNSDLAARNFLTNYSANNAEKLAGMEVNVKRIPGLDMGSRRYYMIAIQDVKNGAEIGTIEFFVFDGKDVEGANGEDIVNTTSDYAYVAMTDVNQDYQGKGLSKVLYAELGERLRRTGVTELGGDVTDQLGRPIAARKAIFEDTEILDVDRDYDGAGNTRTEVISTIDPKRKLSPPGAGDEVTDRSELQSIGEDALTDLFNSHAEEGTRPTVGEILETLAQANGEYGPLAKVLSDVIDEQTASREVQVPDFNAEGGYYMLDYDWTSTGHDTKEDWEAVYGKAEPEKIFVGDVGNIEHVAIEEIVHAATISKMPADLLAIFRNTHRKNKLNAGTQPWHLEIAAKYAKEGSNADWRTVCEAYIALNNDEKANPSGPDVGYRTNDLLEFVVGVLIDNTVAQRMKSMPPVKQSMFRRLLNAVKNIFGLTSAQMKSMYGSAVSAVGNIVKAERTMQPGMEKQFAKDLFGMGDDEGGSVGSPDNYKSSFPKADLVQGWNDKSPDYTFEDGDYRYELRKGGTAITEDSSFAVEGEDTVTVAAYDKNGNLVGVAEGDRKLGLFNLHVVDNHQKKGIGRNLVKAFASQFEAGKEMHVTDTSPGSTTIGSDGKPSFQPGVTSKLLADALGTEFLRQFGNVGDTSTDVKVTESMKEAIDKWADQTLKPYNVNNITQVGAMTLALAWKAARAAYSTFQQFKNAMVSAYGKGIIPLLKRAWEQSKSFRENTYDFISARILSSIADKAWQNSDRNKQSPTLRKIANLIFSRPGPDADVVDNDIPTRINLVRTQFRNAYARIIERFALEFSKMNAEQRAEWDRDFRDAVIGRTTPSDPKIAKAVEDYRKAMRRILEFQRQAGVTLGDVGENYFPRRYSGEAVQANYDEFVKAAAEAYRKRDERLGNPAKTDEQYQEMAESWARNILYGDVTKVSLFNEGQSKSSANSTDPRLFNEDEASLLDDFLVQDIDRVTDDYINSAVKFAEIARAFGEDGAGFRKMLGQLIREGVSSDVIEETEELTKKALSIGGGGLSSKAAKFFDWTGIPLAAMLGKAFIYNVLLEPASFGIRTGSPMLALQGVAETWRNFIGYLAKPNPAMRQRIEQKFGSIKAFRDNLEQSFAEDLGLLHRELERAYINAHWNYETEEKGSPLAKWLVNRIYKSNLMASSEHAKIQASVAIARIALLKNAKLLLGTTGLQKVLSVIGDVDVKESVATILRENGIADADHQAFAEWVQKLEGMTEQDWYKAVTNPNDRMAALYRRAVQKMSIGMSIKTNPALKTSINDSILGRMLMQLMNYQYAFANLVKDRMWAMASKAFKPGGDITIADRARYAAPLIIGGTLSVMAALGTREIVGAMFPSEGMEKRKKEGTPAQVWDAASLAGMFGPKFEYLTKIAQRKQIPGGPTMESGGKSIAAAFNLAKNPNDNGVRGVAKQAYRVGVKPATVAIAAAAHPFFGFIAIQATNRSEPEEAFQATIAGPKRK